MRAQALLLALVPAACSDGGTAGDGAPADVGGADAGRDGAADAAGDAGPAPFVTCPLSVDGPFLRDEDRRAVFLHGINVSNRAKGDHPLHVGTASPEAMARIAAWGFDSIRLLTFWGAVMKAPEGAGPEGLEPDHAYLAKLDEMVGWAADAGLLVVLDMHQDIYGYGFAGNGAPHAGCDPVHYEGFEPTSPWHLAYFDPRVQACFDLLYTDTPYRQAFVDAWQVLAARFGGDCRIVAFDLINEPHWGTYAPGDFLPDRLLPFYRILVDVIRRADPTRLIAAEPHTLLQFSVGMGTAPFDRPGILWAPHYYHPMAHEGQAYGEETRGLLVDAPIDRHADYGAEVIGGGGRAALWFGELGAPPVEGDTALALHMLAAFDRHLASWAIWSYDAGGFGALRGDGTVRTDYLQVVLRPHVRRVAGTPERVVWDDEAGTLTLEHTTSGPGESILWAGATAAGLEGDGAAPPPDVEVTSTDPDGAWSWEADGGLVQVRHDPERERHVVVLRRLSE